MFKKGWKAQLNRDGIAPNKPKGKWLQKANLERYSDNARNAIQWYRDHRQWFKLGESLLRTIYYAREGGPATTAAACVSIGASVVDAIFPESSIEDNLRDRGYHRVNVSIGELLCGFLEQNGSPTFEIKTGIITAKIWEVNGQGAAAIYQDDKYRSGPFVLGGDEDFLCDAIARTVWGHGDDIMLTAKSEDDGFNLVPIPKPGPYVGNPGPEYFAERLEHYGRRPRSMLIKGPTGVGKSVLARRIGMMASHDTTRTLKVSSMVLRGFGAAELRDLAKFTQPSVLLLDDLCIIGGDRYEPHRNRENIIEPLLDLLEALRVDGCLVIITMMVQTSREDGIYRGDNYVEGMRPGRIDEIVTLYPPTNSERRSILSYYYDVFGVKVPTKLRKQIVRKTDGLTGAYLKEVAERLAVHGEDEFVKEIENVLQSAPGLPPKPKRRRGMISYTKRKPPSPAQIRQKALALDRRADSAINKAEREQEKLRVRAANMRKRADAKEKKLAEKKEKAKAKAAKAKAKGKAPKKAAKNKKPTTADKVGELRLVNPRDEVQRANLQRRMRHRRRSR